jgi:pimeloyl-ACP methyl ester carboxylesterase
MFEAHVPNKDLSHCGKSCGLLICFSKRFELIVQPRLGLFILSSFMLFGCATPVGVTKVGTDRAYQQINANATTGPMLSPETKIVLNRFDLLGQFDKDPAAVIALLHERTIQDPRRDLRFALAELSFLRGKQLEQKMTINGKPTGAADYYLLAAVFAYDYLLGPGSEEHSDPYDPRTQMVADLYNLALGKGFATGKDGRLEFKNGVRVMPIGRLEISLNLDKLSSRLEDFDNFLPADDYTVYGLTVRNRTSGLGLPLIALHKGTPEHHGGLVSPVTVFLRIAGEISSQNDKTTGASLEFYYAYDDTEMTVNGRTVSLETDSTASLAYQLSNDNIWKEFGLGQFLSGGKKQRLIIIQPYQPGRIPVVFIHGTASSPLWWAEMWNTLRSDPALRRHYQFWFLMYNSSIPVPFSAADFRLTLMETVAKLDPEGKDPAMHEMVLIGHSQGGLLAKMSVVNSGDAIWRSISDVSPEDLKTTPEIKKLMREYFYVEPLPFVKRVVFIATPHRGSFRTTSWVRRMIRGLVTLPLDPLTTDPIEYLNVSKQLKLPTEMRGRMLTSIDSLSAFSPVLQTLVKLPITPDVKANSIIAVEGDGDPTKGNDGVVAYTSAHLDGVESEYIVRSEHSCQSNPFTIEEVRRILLLHLASLEKIPE